MGFERPGWDEYFMLQAELAKLRSNCISRKVGAVIARGHRQIATGYNGTPPGARNCYEGGCQRCADRMAGRVEPGEDLSRCLCSHAEANAIMHCAILGIEAGRGGDLYTTYAPCLECTKMAITIGIRRFVCLERYPEDDQGLAEGAGITIEMLDRSAISRWAASIGGV
ncbi:MAG: dCMP deaminase family protein [Nitrosopumilus sp.]|nr:dCMP deaminase family protein [Nitrosopumilus sp.]CAI9831363.1 dCMP deaminase [Nitrosopumilaceae archaeon]MDA7940898.1 dCMP deaminase family protein [Nitrosopumilus sp.]MDA7943246.1 dCMP deaminase family protein [Nitrosopumilus sp.]MDA7944260.1 dCMP deaminase family protein [Nitrosopumilus sp.]